MDQCKNYSYEATQDDLASRNAEFAGPVEAVVQVIADSCQVERLKDSRVPVFFSEYNDGSQEPREWRDLVNLYSPPVSNILSGLCVYQFYELSNGYGLVRKFRRDRDTRWAAQREALAQSDDPTKVIRTHEVGVETLLVYHDFNNLKTKLASILTLENDLDDDHTGDIDLHRTGDKGHVELTQKRWPWEPQYSEPEDCVDWTIIEDRLRT